MGPSYLYLPISRLGSRESKSFLALERRKAKSVRIASSLLVPLALALGTLAACHRNDPSPTTSPSASAAPAPRAPAAPPLPLDRIGTVREGSTVVLAKLGAKRLALVADEDGSAVRAIDLATRTEVGSLGVPGRPAKLLVTREGKLLVALRDDGAVLVAEAHADGSLKSLDRIPTAVEPVALALSPDDQTLWVACGFAQKLEGFTLATKERVASIPVAREPRAVLVSRDGTKAFVAHGADGVVENVNLASKTATPIDLGIAALSITPLARPVRPMIDFDALVPVDDFDECLNCGFGGRFTSQVFMPARFARQGYALARIERRGTKGDGLGEVILEPHGEVMTGDPRAISSGYGGGGIEDLELPTNTFGFSLLDPEQGRRIGLRQAEARTDKTACHLPRAVATDDDHVFVACLGSSALFAYPRAPKGDVRANPDLRLPVAAGPNGVALDPETKEAVVFSAFDGVLTVTSSVVAAKDAAAPAKIEIRLARKSALSELEQQGRALFHSAGDPRIAADGRSCSSCHPDGRDDGLTWSTPNGPRQTIQLAGRINRPAPFGWMGKHASLQIHMTQTMQNLKGTGLAPTELDALAAYLKVMKGAPQKWRALTAEESRGKELFASSDTGCSGCHGEKTGFSDHDVHDVKSATPSDVTGEFLVPSLVGVGGSAPYFHDGRYASLEELLAKTDGTMGTTKSLSPEDKKALVAYLRTL
jgi:cytochrome c peroxidase